MKNLKDNELKPDQSWQQAEKMLDRHFRNKRILTWSLSIFISAFVIVGSIVGINYFSGSYTSIEKNTAVKESSSDQASKQNHKIISAEGTKVEQSASVKETELSKAAIKNESKQATNTTNSHAEKNKTENKVLTEKKNVITENSRKERKNKVEAQATIVKKELAKNSSPSNPPLKNQDSQHNGEIVSSVVDNTSLNLVKNEKSNSDRLVSDQLVFALMNPVRVSQIPFETNNDYALASSEKPGAPLKSLCATKLNLMIYGSAQYVSKTLESKQYTDYVTRRKNEELGIITNSMGASLICSIKNFSISVGMEYSSWGEKNSYSSYLIKKTAIEDGNWLYRADYDTAYISGNMHIFENGIDSTFNSHTDTVVKSTIDPSVYHANGTNKFYFIEVPVEISYRFTRCKIGIGVTAGISPAWLVREKGYYLKRDLSGVEAISEIQSTNKFMMNGRFSIDFYYALTDRINFILRPQFRANLNSIFKNEYGVNQRYYSSGLAFGLVYSIR